MVERHPDGAVRECLRCSRPTLPGSNYCWDHQTREDSAADVEQQRHDSDIEHLKSENHNLGLKVESLESRLAELEAKKEE